MITPTHELTTETDNTAALDTDDASGVAPTASRMTGPGSNRRFNIPGDTVRKATAELPSDQRDAIIWLHSYGYDNNISYEDLGAKLRQPDGSTYDRHTVWSVLTGRHQASKQNICKAIRDFKRLVEERATITRTGYIHLGLGKKIFSICDATLIYQRFSLIFGATQIGKTEALIKFAEDHNHGQTTYVRMPEGGRYTDFIRRLATVLRISPGADNIKDRIIASFDSQKLLIIDEAHQPFITGTSTAGFRPLEFIREIWDTTKCGVVLCATDVLDEQFQRGSLKGVLAQISQRRLLTLRLPPKPAKKDLNLVAQHYGLDPATDEALILQGETIRDSGLGRWITILQAASRLSEKRGQSLDWEHVIKAHAAFLKLEDPTQD